MFLVLFLFLLLFVRGQREPDLNFRLSTHTFCPRPRPRCRRFRCCYRTRALVRPFPSPSSLPRRCDNVNMLPQSADLSSSCAGSTSPRKDEAPPGFDPLGVDEDVAEGAQGTRGRGRGGMTSSSSSTRPDVQVAFPPDFEAAHSGGSSSAEAGKARSSDSLGTKSGSTSLLSMMSGSPRSLGTAHSPGAGSPSPRTDLSDISSTDEAATAGGLGGSGRREGASAGAATAAAAATAAPVSTGEGSRDLHRLVAHDPWSCSGADVEDLEFGGVGASAPPRRLGREGLPDVSLAVQARGDAADEEDDEADLPSAHPTPLSVFGSAMDLPSDHPTPLSTLGSTRRSSGGTGLGLGAARGLGIRTKTSPFGSGGSVKIVNPASGSFIQRLKYWGGGSSSKDRDPGALSPAAAATRARHSTGSNNAPADFSQDATAVTGGREGGSLGSREEDLSPGFDKDGGGGLGGSGSVRAREPTGYSGQRADPRGVGVAQFDSVTSDAASAYTSAVAPDQLWRATAPPRVSPLRDNKHPGKPSPTLSSSFPSPSAAPRQHLRVVSRGSDADGFAAMAPMVAISKPTEKEVSVVNGGSNDTAAGSAGRKYSGFGAEHRAELAALRLARGTPAPGDEEVGQEEEEEEEEKKEEEQDVSVKFGVRQGVRSRAESAQSEMDWYSPSDLEEKKMEEGDQHVDEEEEMMHEVAALSMAEKLANMATPHARGLGSGPTSTDNQHMSYQPASPPPVPPPPRYMAIVDAASVHSGLDNSSTSEQDTSVSEDDGGMMAEILTDRIMEVCSKMEAAAAPPADELSDGEGGATGGPKRRPSRRRQLSNMSSSRTIVNKDQVSFLSFFHVNRFCLVFGGRWSDGGGGKASTVVTRAAVEHVVSHYRQQGPGEFIFSAICFLFCFWLFCCWFLVSVIVGLKLFLVFFRLFLPCLSLSAVEAVDFGQMAERLFASVRFFYK